MRYESCRRSEKVVEKLLIVSLFGLLAGSCLVRWGKSLESSYMASSPNPQATINLGTVLVVLSVIGIITSFILK